MLPSQNIYEQKYGKSINGRQCLGPCYKPAIWTIHPVTLGYITDEEHPFCPTERYKDEELDKFVYLDRCKQPTDNIDNTALEMNVISPEIDFSCNNFLKIYYKIYSFENAVEWILKNKYKSVLTKLRILSCSWRAYNITLEVLTNDLIDVYINIIKKYWIKTIYKYISKYIRVTKKKIHFSTKGTANNKNKVEKINFIIKKLITKNNIYKIMSKYIRDNMNNWSQIGDYNKNILDYIIKYFINKMEAM